MYKETFSPNSNERSSPQTPSYFMEGRGVSSGGSRVGSSEKKVFLKEYESSPLSSDNVINSALRRHSTTQDNSLQFSRSVQIMNSGGTYRSPESVKEIEKLLTKSLSPKIKSPEQDSITLLKQQLQHIQQIKLESQRKDLHNRELQTQVDELTIRMKEDAAAHKQECALWKEKVNQLELEANKTTDDFEAELLKMRDIERQSKFEATRLTQLLSEERNNNTKEIKELKNAFTILVTDAEKSEMKKQQLETQLNELQVQAKKQQQMTEEKTAEQKKAILKLQSQIIVLTNSRTEFQTKNSELEAKNREIKIELNERHTKIAHLSQELQQIKLANEEKQQLITNFENNLSQAKGVFSASAPYNGSTKTTTTETIHELQLETSAIPELKKQVVLYQNLRKEMTKLKSSFNELQEVNDKEKMNSRILMEENNRLQEIQSQVETNLEEMSKVNLKLKLDLNELREKQKLFDTTTKELEHHKLSSLENLSKFEKSMRIKEDSDEKIRKDVDKICDFLQQLVEVVGGNVEKIVLNIQSKLLQPIQSPLQHLSTMYNEYEEEVISLREKCKSFYKDNVVLQQALQMKEQDIINSKKEIMILTKSLNDKTKDNSNLEEQLASLQVTSSELNDKLMLLADEEKRKIRFITTLFSKISGKFFEGNNTDQLSWDSLSQIFFNITNSTTIEMDSLKKEIYLAKNKLKESESNLDQTSRSLRESWEQNEKNKIDHERKLSSELENQRITLESLKDSIVKQVNIKLKNVDNELSELKIENSDLSIENKKMQITNDNLKKDLKTTTVEKEKLITCLRLVVKSMRPFRNQISDLICQKKVLTSMIKSCEQQNSHLLQSLTSVTSNTSSLTATIPKQKTSLRAAIYSVIIVNRLQLLLKHRHSITQIGNEKIKLLPTSELSIRKDIPFVIKEESSSGFHQLCQTIDPNFDNSGNDFTFLHTLQSGYLKQTKKSKSCIVHENPVRILNSSIDKVVETTIIQSRETLKEKVSLQKRCHEVSDELLRVNQKIVDLESHIDKKQELINYMESRISSLQDENLRLIHPEKLSLQQRDIEKLRQQLSSISAEKEQYKRELDIQFQLSHKFKQEIQVLQDEHGSKDSQIETVEKELNEKKQDCLKLQRVVKRLTEQVVDMEQERKRNQFRASEKQFKQLTAPFSTSLLSEEDEEEEEVEDMVSPHDFGSDKADIKKMMKTLSENNASASKNLNELDREIAKARSKLAELQQNMIEDEDQPVLED